MSYFVYIIYSSKLNRYYIGTTDDVEKRLNEHNESYYKNAFTSKGIPWILFHTIQCPSSEAAYKLELFIKKMKSTSFLQKLKSNPQLENDILKKIK